MPIVRIDMWEGRDVATKRRLAAEVTDAVTRTLGCDPSSVRVLITEFPTDHWAIGGELQSDRAARPPE